MIVDFYHLTTSPLERVLPSICEKLLAADARLLVVASDEAALARLDEQLWGYSSDAFLPHGREGSEDQPILLATEPRAANGARNIALADGRWRDEALTFDRAFYFFGEDMLDEARTAWRGLKDRTEVEARYWKQDDRSKWVKGP